MNDGMQIYIAFDPVILRLNKYETGKINEFSDLTNV